MSYFFWFSDELWAQLEPHLATNQPGTRRADFMSRLPGLWLG